MSRRIVIAGGGAIGQSAASFILRSDPDAEVTVVERDPTYAMASSALSASSIRQQFSTPANIALSQFSYAFIESLHQSLGHDALGLRPCAYLFLAADTLQAERLETRAEAVREAGGEVRRYGPAELVQTFPWLKADDLVCGHQSLWGEGWFDGYALMNALKGDARSRGARYMNGDVVGIDTVGDRTTGVRLATGERLGAEQVLIAAGAWSRELGATAGLDLPVHRRRRSVFTFESPAKVSDFPVLIDPTGVFVRRDADCFLSVVSPDSSDDPDDLPLDPDFTIFEDRIWPILAERIPGFEQLRVRRAWAGYYEYNPLDQNGLIGAAGPDGLFVATGFSGHGLMHCPGVGRGVAELMTTGAFATIDLTPLRPGRFAEGKLVREEACY